jgi:DNA polymerase elongation subunit (family B)
MSDDENIDNNKKEISFQILEWNEYNIEDSIAVDEGDKNSEHEEKIMNKYALRLFGRTDDDKTICCVVTDFTPYFYIKLDKTLINLTHSLVEKIRENIYPRECADGFKGFKLLKKYDFSEFSNFTKFDFLRLDFYNTNSMNACARTLKRKLFFRGKKIKLKMYESNLLPMLRLMHIRKLNAVGWVKINKYNTCNTRSSCDINISCKWTHLNNFEEMKNQKFTICSFDIECVSKDGSFPDPTRPTDEVIQIGITMSRYGEDECYYKHIITLKSCSPLDGIVVEHYETEKEVLLAFSKLIRELDPDIITGYNIKGFDFNYLNERAKLLKIHAQFSRMSRIKNDISEFVIKDLSSSALGENKLKYFDMKGRVIFDVMKVIQRDHKLPSYKLDEVSSSFIRDTVVDIENNKNNEDVVDINKDNIYVKTKFNDKLKTNNFNEKTDIKTIELRKSISMKLDTNNEKINIDKIENTTHKTAIIHTKNTNGIYIGQYIKICYNDGFTENKYLEGKKFKILDLSKKSILIDGEIDTTEILNKGFKVYWTQAKDDIGPNDIFRMQDQGPNERAIIAKYCIQDCALCNKLIAKLQILTNNIGMANVCSVPLSFLFLRGQGIKIFSLVAKKCRDKEHLIQTHKVKPKPEDTKTVDIIAKQSEFIEKTINNKHQYYEDDEDDEEDNMGYEGATVFEPVTGVHYNPIYVLDFSSLYPSSMIMRNLSHEMHVIDSKYDNLPGYIYHDIEYKNADNTRTKCRFAEKQDGSKGIIPEILQELLTARKKYKKQMEKMKEEGGDQFMIAILDGLQQAYKVTANSLYGQTGAPTSPIYKKQIAASTTATGREMLQFSKHFNEHIYLRMINLSLEGKYDEFIKYCNEIYEYFPTDITLTNNLTNQDDIVHVCSVKNKKIPDSKFIRGIIDYHLKNEDYMIKNYGNILKLIDINNIEELKIKFNELSKISYKDRYAYLNKIKNNKNIKKMDNFNLFYDDIFWQIENFGYKTKDELFDKFYNTMRYLLCGYKISPQGIYGDTDSVFISPHIKDLKTNTELIDKNGLKKSIILGIWASIMITTILPSPMAQEYEKVLWPFIIITKKRYVGNLYEKDPEKFYQKSMGIVLKRRDNAPVVKIVCGNIIDQILNKRSSEGAVKMTQMLLNKIITGGMPLDKFIITKTLKFSYKDRTRIVHAVLADRMAERDPGNKPESNDRIPYVYFEVENEKDIKLQGERVEHPDYLLKNNLKIDYLFYITNQIMKPCIQFLELIVENADKIFKDYIVREENRKLGKAPIRYYMQGKQISVDKFSEILDNNLDDLSKKCEEKPRKRIVKKVVKRIIKTKKEEEKDNIQKEIKKNQSVKTINEDKIGDLFKI